MTVLVAVVVITALTAAVSQADSYHNGRGRPNDAYYGSSFQLHGGDWQRSQGWNSVRSQDQFRHPGYYNNRYTCYPNRGGAWGGSQRNNGCLFFGIRF